MPVGNSFQHQDYEFQPTGRFETLRPQVPPSVESDESNERLAKLGEQLEAARVRAIFLVHGSFVGNDALGFIREFARIAPGVSERLKRNRKKLLDNLAGESGNFTSGYAAYFRACINAKTSSTIDVQSFHWSSENHHIGRSDGAIRLLERLLDEQIEAPDRVLLWGHSHAGNVFALMTNLLGGDENTKQRFFKAAQPFARSHSNSQQGKAWQRVHDWLTQHNRNPFLLDLVTFGTPVRYGWESRGFSNLLHFVSHRPIENLPIYQAQFPVVAENLIEATYGDYVQQLGIAGTNLMPFMLNPKNWLAERQLNQLLQPGIRKRDLIGRLIRGHRIHQDGMTLLVDYPDDERSLRKQSFGHGIYTFREWLPFHCEELVKRFYAE